MNGARRLLLLAQLAFWTCVVLCFAVTGGGLSDNHGFSVYGGRWTTILPWTVGISAAAVLIWRAADAVSEDDQALARCLRINVVLLRLHPAHAGLDQPALLRRPHRCERRALPLPGDRRPLARPANTVGRSAAAVRPADRRRSRRRRVPGAVDRPLEPRHLRVPARLRRAARQPSRRGVTPSRARRSARSAARSKPFGARSPSRKSRERMQYASSQ